MELKLKEVGYPFPQSSESLSLENTRLNNKYIIFDIIAAGSHSTVYYGIQQASGQERAFKFYNLKEIEKQRGFKEKELCKRLSNYEYQMMAKCNSEHILKCYDIFETRDYKVIVYEYCNMKSLEKELNQRKSKFTTQAKAIMIIKQIISGLKNMHQNTQKFHKHLTPKNILARYGIYKIVDFGLPVSYEVDEESSPFLIPEIMMKKSYDQKAEVWNIGVLFHQILFSQLPFALTRHVNKSYLISNSVKNIFKDQGGTYSKNVIMFLQNCLATDPQERMTWEELQNHPMLMGNQNQPPKSFISLAKNVQNKKPKASLLSLILPVQYDESNNLNEQSAKIYCSKFLFEKQRDQLEKQLQKTYVKLGESLQFVEVEPISRKHWREQVNKGEQNRFKELQTFYLQCLKADFFYNQVIKVLISIPKFLQSRKNIEFIFLILSRCFFQLSYINMFEKSKFNYRERQIIFCISKITKKLYEEVHQSWKQFSKKIYTQENKFSSIFSDKWNKFKNNQEYQKKQQILGGIEGKDYQRGQQIYFTIDFYRQQLIQNDLMAMVNNQPIKKNSPDYYKQLPLIKQVLSYMKIYVNIWNMQQYTDSYSCLKEYIDVQLLSLTK